MSAGLTRSMRLSVGFLLLAGAAVRGDQGPAQTPAPPAAQTPAPPSPVQLANQAERLRIMKELKISAIPPGAVSASPATYNEADANPYPDLPDPLTLKNGQKVTSAPVWRSKRRPELLEDFQREIYGRTPKNVPKVTWKVVNTAEGSDGDIPTITKQLLGFVDNAAYPSINVIIQATLTTPAKATRGVPVIIQFGGGPCRCPKGRRRRPIRARRPEDSARAAPGRDGAPGRALARRPGPTASRARPGSSRFSRRDGASRT